MHSALNSPGSNPRQGDYRILIADDHSIVRIGLRSLIAAVDSSIRMEDARDGESVISMLKAGTFDLLILDINMPDTESFSLSGYIIKEFPTVRIMIFTMCRELSIAMRFLKLGIHGYLIKDAGEKEVQLALRTVMGGGVYLGDWLSQAISEDRITPRSNSPFDRLSDRELEVALQLIKGVPISRIADALHLNRSTIGTHKSRIVRKLKVANTIELVNLAKVCGLI